MPKALKLTENDILSYEDLAAANFAISVKNMKDDGNILGFINDVTAIMEQCLELAEDARPENSDDDDDGESTFEPRIAVCHHLQTMAMSYASEITLDKKLDDLRKAFVTDNKNKSYYSRLVKFL